MKCGEDALRDQDLKQANQTVMSVWQAWGLRELNVFPSGGRRKVWSEWRLLEFEERRGVVCWSEVGLQRF
jgi:hypothetical protein